MRQAKDALASAVEDMEKDHESLPPSIEEDAVPDYDRSSYHDPRTLLVPVEEETWAAREMQRVGAEVIVLEPETLRERMVEIARRYASFYGV